MNKLQKGDRLGRYEIIAALGAGGMGVVYRAQDPKLGREVALKVLPDEFSIDPERLTRFEREARAASALNHPKICTIHDVGEHDGTPFLVMELLDGQSLREAMDAGPLDPSTVVSVGADVADALAAAHDAGIVHRDIKPANIFITERGDAKVLDFGLARIDDGLGEENIDLEAPTMHSPDLTRPGTAMGTVSHMSPEQVLGRRVDAKTDVFSLGVVLYEMATGSIPFSGKTSGAVFDKIVHEAPTAPVKLNPDLPRELQRVVNGCLQKDAADRATAEQLRDDLAKIGRELAGEDLGVAHHFKKWLRKPAFWLISVAAMVVATLTVTLWSNHAAKARWAREVALPKIRQLSADTYTPANIFKGIELIRAAEPYVGDDSDFQDLKARIVATPSVRTEPPGADVWVKPYGRPDAEWQHLGTTPLETVELPSAYLRWKIEKPGFETIIDARHTADIDSETGLMIAVEREWSLEPIGVRPPGMIRVPGDDEVPAFLVDRHEVTNRQFKEFVTAGGYDDPKYWIHEFELNGQTLESTAARALFVDQTGRSGPSTWEAGDFPDGHDQYPVTGVSWYEAAAFAQFAGKTLPTITHWGRARGIFLGPAQWLFTGLLIPISNFHGNGPIPVDSSHAMTPLGAFDMAGNVREWCFNRAPVGRCLRGGAWNDATYMFGNITQAGPFDRSEKNGFRCVIYSDETVVPEAFFEPYAPDSTRDLRNETPVSDEVFEAYRSLFAVDPLPLEPTVTSRHENEDWIRESVSYAAAYGDERITAQMFLPTNVDPPYQAVLYFPGSSAVRATATDELESRLEFKHNVEFLLKTGRAVLYPAYRGTHERQHGISPRLHWSLDPTNEFTSFQVNIVKDAMRSVDYLQSRDDIQHGKIAYTGFSWGGTIANLNLALENRFAAAVLNVGGMVAHGTPRPEVDYLNYAPRITLPVLMLNGRFDLALLYDSEVQPMFDLLGTPPEHKRLIVYETDHWIDRREVAKETLAWLDRYLGPVHAPR